ncbi:hypothetical protein ADICYQ_0640 [Cyclobacterium qasimii M12-11B]|uniref:Uncharacterized protein n=1 Tax=Cyclobacterium qasimii M12-11B TaxID=641524 RepID=S7WW90_9BACT|nr:hypothetical protein ADICYQ_0640 [Cyclobacterium qasimii M12-11B]
MGTLKYPINLLPVFNISVKSEMMKTMGAWQWSEKSKMRF